MRFCGFGVFVMVKYRKSEGKNIRRVVKVFFWRRMGNLENINWGCSFVFGGWFVILSFYLRVSFIFFIWE